MHYTSLKSALKDVYKNDSQSFVSHSNLFLSYVLSFVKFELLLNYVLCSYVISQTIGN